MNADEIKKLLAEKHAADVFVPECKNGPTHDTDGLLILDAWAMPRSWVHPHTVGYEIKISRRDFEQDQKWLSYLPLCHKFYFVCPAGLISAADLAPGFGVGLIWVSKSGRLHTKLKADVRKPEPAAFGRLCHYVLMCRSKIVHPNALLAASEEEDRHTLITRMVERAEKNKELAVVVNAHVRARFADVNDRLEGIERRCNAADELRKHLADRGIEWNDRQGIWPVKTKIDELVGMLPHNLAWLLESAQAGLGTAIKAIKKLEER